MIKIDIAIDRNIDYEIRRQKAIEQELGSQFIRTDPDKEDCNTFKAINEIFRHFNQLTKQSTKETVTDKISVRLLR